MKLTIKEHKSERTDSEYSVKTRFYIYDKKLKIGEAIVTYIVDNSRQYITVEDIEWTGKDNDSEIDIGSNMKLLLQLIKEEIHIKDYMTFMVIPLSEYIGELK